ncbi:MAG: class I SAM-dependent methyltransferase, partial [bacterium]|nr:class I SAM-dependent methyltransferase [bacterium]
MDNYVNNQIVNNNPWYTGSHFEWAESESIKRIYKQRHIFFNKIINREITKKGKITLLDYGCGDGYWTSIFSKSPMCEVVGVDYNKLRLERCKINAPN